MSTLQVDLLTGEETFTESPEVYGEAPEPEFEEAGTNPALKLAEGLSTATTIAQIRSVAKAVAQENIE